MPVTIDGTTGVSAVQAGAVTTSDLPAGSVLQVVNAITTTYTGITGTTFAAVTNLTATITPTSATSKILVVISIGEWRTPGNCGGRFSLYKNGSVLLNIGDELGWHGGGSSATFGMSYAYSYVDSPATTSATTYALFAKKLVNNSGDLQIMPNGNAHSTIQLLEIAA
jgi:hypothetical protein